LKIDNSQINDIGNYAVVAENEAGRDETHCNVFVTQEPGIDQRPMVNPEAFRYLQPQAQHKPREVDVEPKIPPKVIVPLQNVKLQEGQNIFLACKVIGTPRPNVCKAD
jgi:hypothetical protein